jgi:chromosome segregation ATPase
MLNCFLVTRLLEQQKKLEADEEAAGNALIGLQAQLSVLQTQVSEAVSRLARIRRMRNKVKERSSELFRRGMQEAEDLDELERLETEERQGAEAGSLDAAQLPPDVLDTIDWNSLGFSAGFDAVVGESSSANVGH